MRQMVSLYLTSRDVSPDYAQALRRVASSMETFGITPLNLESSLFNAWLSSLPRSRTTKANYRRMGLTLWAFAARRKLCPSVGDDILKVKPSSEAPVAWTKDELIRLIVTAEGQVGTFRTSDCPKGLFWKAWVLIGYETGIRMSDLMNLKTAQLRQNRLYVVHHKTGIPQGKLLSVEAVRLFRAMSAMNGGSGTVFRWALSRKHIFLHFKKLCKAAGLQGSTKYLRRTGATYCEIAQPGSAKRFLGHLSEGLATRFYIDPTLVSADCPRPPDFLSTEGLPVSDRGVRAG